MTEEDFVEAVVEILQEVGGILISYEFNEL